VIFIFNKNFKGIAAFGIGLATVGYTAIAEI
jgi:hypothetical protein